MHVQPTAPGWLHSTPRLLSVEHCRPQLMLYTNVFVLQEIYKVICIAVNGMASCMQACNCLGIERVLPLTLCTSHHAVEGTAYWLSCLCMMLGLGHAYSCDCTVLASLWRIKKAHGGQQNGEHRESNSGPLPPEGRIIPLDHVPSFLGGQQGIDEKMENC